MGKGDKKTKRGKLFKGSYGKLRPKKHEVKTIKSTKPAAPAVKKKQSKGKKAAK